MAVKCTIYENTFNMKPFYMTVDKALDRIKMGSSADKIARLRLQVDYERQVSLKKNLPCVLFSGEFVKRENELIIGHTGFIVLDFDGLNDAEQFKTDLTKNELTYACWISPRGNGVKLLLRIADGKKHLEHFEALKDVFPSLDKSGGNVARICYESYDPHIFINKNSKIFTGIKKYEKIVVKTNIDNERAIFTNLVKWLSNRNDTFITGERNVFIFKLASACCRFGLADETCSILIKESYEIGTNNFSVRECESTIASAYKANRDLVGTAQFDKETLVDRTTRREIEITQEMLDENIRPKDVIFGEDVKDEALEIFLNGYQSVKGIGVDSIDRFFKLKEGENTLFSGYGNYGKSTFLKWKLLMRVLLYGEKFAIFSPEDFAPEFYHDIVEILLGENCVPANPNRPSRDEYEFAFDFVSRYFFYVFPKTLSPTPDYIKERFLELIIKQGVKGIVVDPFNQLANDYKGSLGRTDKYLETFLSDSGRFARQNNVYSIIVAHPVKGHKDASGNYPCPDVFDIADGAMWNNKMDNIIIYHRPNHQTEPDSDECELHSKKIRRQKSVGKIGKAEFSMNRKTRRYLFNGVDYMATTLSNSDFYKNEKKVFNPGKKIVDFTEPVQEQFQIQPNYDYEIDDPF